VVENQQAGPGLGGDSAAPAFVIMARRMPLTRQEELLIGAVRRLPAGAAGELTALAERLAALAGRTGIDWSDAWSEEDLREYSAASAVRVAEGPGDEAA